MPSVSEKRSFKACTTHNQQKGSAMKRYMPEWMKNFIYNSDNLRQSGIELELPVISKNGEAFSVIPSLEMLSREPGCEAKHDDIYTQQLIEYKDPIGCAVTPEYSTSVVELAFDPTSSLWEAKQRYEVFLKNFISFFNAQGAYVPGYGAIPCTCNPVLTKKRRYEVLREFLGPKVDVIGLTASNQVSVEVGPDEMLPALNVCNAFSGISIALTANSSIIGGRDTKTLAYREIAWDHFSRGRSGITPRRFSDIEEYFEFITGFEMVLEKGEKDYFIPNKTFTEKMAGKFDLDLFRKIYPLHEGTVWHNARLRAPYGTIEVRPNCAQPHKDFLVIAAFWLGIVEALDEAVELEKAVDWSIWQGFRRACAYDGLNAKVEGIDAKSIVRDILSISASGLRSRGLGEEELLMPLWERLDRGRTLAEDVRDIFHEKGMQAVIEHIV